MIKLLYIALVFLSVFSFKGQAQTCTANPGTGNWTDASTWSCGVVPTNGSYDNIVIPAGAEVLIQNGETIAFSDSVFIEVYGTLTVGETGGGGTAVLELSNANSSLQIYTGGSVGGTNKGQISIGSPPAWEFIPGNQVDDGFVGPQSITPDGSGEPLPVQLIFFKTGLDGVKVNLSWATAQELNFDYFSLERSSDGVNFKEVAQINGAGNSTARIDYEYVDEFPMDGISYYRLKSIDFDGYTEIFDYAMVKTEGLAPAFAIFPNPVSGGAFTLLTNFTSETPMDLAVFNNAGRIEGQYIVSDWLNTFELSNLQPGSYILKLAAPGGTIVKRILIR